MSKSATPSVFVDAGNDTPGRKSTSVSVGGSNFPPGSALNIKLNHGARGAVMVGPDGSFEWGISIRPPLGCGAPVVATVHGSDGIELTGESDVFCP